MLKYLVRRYNQLGATIDGVFVSLDLKYKGGKVNLTRRNVATSRMASLLELKDLIAESQTVDILDEATGKTIRGNLMNQAEGKEHEEIENSLKERKITSTFLRDITNLQVLDYLCGQVDRHAGNMMYKVDGDGNVTGVQGIDNDGAFGLKENAGRVARVFDTSSEEMFIPYMDAHLADRIMELDGDTLRYALMDLIKEEEINEAIKRLHTLQKGIENIRQKEAFRFLENKDDWTLHENHQEAKNLITRGGWNKVLDEELKNPELAAENRRLDKSVEYSFLHRYRELYSVDQYKDKIKEAAKQKYEKSDPERLEYLLRYIEDQKKFEENEAGLVKEVRDMYSAVRRELRDKYVRTQNYFAFIMGTPYGYF